MAVHEMPRLLGLQGSMGHTACHRDRGFDVREDDGGWAGEALVIPQDARRQV